jgi:hypothetical protein
MSAGLSELMQAIFPETARDLMIATGAFYFAINSRERKRIEESVTDLLGPGKRAEKTKRKVFGHSLDFIAKRSGSPQWYQWKKWTDMKAEA